MNESLGQIGAVLTLSTALSVIGVNWCFKPSRSPSRSWQTTLFRLANIISTSVILFT